MAGSPFAIRKIKPAVKRNRFGKFGELPKSIRPTKEVPLRLRSIQPEKGVVSRRRGVVFLRNEREQLEKRAVPHGDVKGSVEERIFYKALVQRRLDFSFQPAVDGGRQELGGLVADFILYGFGHQRGLVVGVNGTIWHTGNAPERRDADNDARLIALGFEVTKIWDYEIWNVKSFNEWMRRFIDFAPIKRGASNVAGTIHPSRI